jgi:putative ABC transport system ATP-binding protein
MNNPMIENGNRIQPTGNLDSTHVSSVIELLSKLNETGSMIIMVTHSSARAEYSNQVVHLFDGHVVTENMKGKFDV